MRDLDPVRAHRDVAVRGIVRSAETFEFMGKSKWSLRLLLSKADGDRMHALILELLAQEGWSRFIRNPLAFEPEGPLLRVQCNKRFPLMLSEDVARYSGPCLNGVDAIFPGHDVKLGGRLFLVDFMSRRAVTCGINSGILYPSIPDRIKELTD